MKYLLIVALVALLGVVTARQLPINEREERDTRDNLLHRADDLVKQCQVVIDDLALENRTHEAEHLESDKAILVKLSAELKAATEHSSILHLEHQLIDVERRVISELRHIHLKPIHEKREKLIKHAEELTKHANDAIKILEGKNKTAEAEQIKKDEETMHQLVAELKEATTTEKLLDLEHKVIEIETRLAKELRKIHARETRDIRDDLLKHAEELLKKSTEAIEKLTKENRTLEIELIQKEDEFLQKLVAQLKDTSLTGDKLKQIELEVGAIEIVLEIELRRLNLRQTRDLKDDLLKHAEELLQKSTEAIEKLTKENRTLEIELIQKEDEFLQKLVAQLKDTSLTGDKLKQIELEVGAIEIVLEIELRRLNLRQTRDIKDDLLKRADELEKKAQEAIDKLTHENRKHQAEHLEHDLAHLKKLAETLKAAPAGSNVAHLEHELSTLEHRITIEIRNADDKPLHDLRERLIKHADVLVKHANEAIKTLESQNKTTEAEEIKKQEEILQKLVVDLKAATTHDELVKLEHEVQAAEKKLQEELRKIHVHTRQARDLKDDLLKRAEILLKRSHEAVEILTNENRKHEAEHIEKEQAELEKLVAKLKEANQHQNIRHLEHEIDNLEHRIQTELDRLHLKPHHDHREELLKRAEQLIKHAEQAIKILEKQNQTAEVQTVKVDEENLKKLAEQLKTADKSHLHELEKEVAAAEAKLGHDLGKIYEEVKKAVILKDCEKLEADVDAEVKKLEASGHEAYTRGFTQQKEQLVQLVSQLRNTTDFHTVQHLEHEIIQLGTFILHELKLVDRDIAFMKHLLERSEAILTRVDALVPELNKHNLIDAADILQAERAELVLLTNEVKNETSIFALTYIETKLDHLEKSLAEKIIELEKKLLEGKSEIRKTRDVRDTLLKRAEELLKRSTEAIEKLTKENRKHEAEHIEREDVILKKLVAQLKDTTINGDKLKQAEREVAAAEARLDYELKHLHLRQTRDVRENLLKRAEELLKRSTEAIEKLTKENRKHEAQHIEKEDEILKKLISELKDTTITGARLVHLEHEIGLVEMRLDAELKHLHLRVARDIRENLLKRAEELLKRSTEAIEKLTKENRKHEAQHIEREDEILKKLAAELKDTHLTHERLAHLEHEIASVEMRLDAELKHLHLRVARDLKEDLLKRAEILLKRSHEAVEILTNENRKHEAEHIEKEQAELEKLVAKLKEAQPHHNIRQLEHEIDNLEHRIQTELDRLHLKPHHDHREELLKRAEQLIKHAEEAIKILENQNQTAEVQTVKVDEENLKKLAEQLKTADNSHLHELEKEVAAAEAKLWHDLGKIHEEVKKAVILKGCEKLEAEVDAEIKKLDSAGHQAYTRGFAQQKEQLVELVSQLRNTTDLHTVQHLEQEIIHLGTFIIHELKLVDRDIAFMKHLLERSESILKRVDALVPELNKHNLIDAADILQAERAELVLLTNEVKNETSIFALTYIETKLDHLEKSLAEKIIELEKKLLE